MVWVDRQGQEDPLGAPPRRYFLPRLSPDGTGVALDVRDQEDDIWIWDLALGTLRRLTSDPDVDIYPVWTPDSLRVAFTSGRAGSRNLFWKAADGTGTVERLTDNPNRQYPHAFSPNGTQFVFRENNPETLFDLAVLSMEGDRPTEAILATESNELNPELSPNGRWLAYQSDASGQYEIYVQPFPDVNQGLEQISTDGGTQPLWGPNGQELFYRSDAGLMVVPVETEPRFTAGTPEVVVEEQYYTQLPRSYDIAPDGQRFLFIKGRDRANRGPEWPSADSRPELVRGTQTPRPHRLIMPLQSGTTLGPYAVTAKIGEGGMGEVYRARDTKLDRDVALKVLPQAFTDDPDRLARFEREAKVLASLNHPNIGAIHDLEESGPSTGWSRDRR